MVNRQQNLPAQIELAVTESLLQQVIRRSDRADQRILDGQASGLRPAFPDCLDHISHFAAGDYFRIGPLPAGCSFAE
jgi:hypothetical protein